MKMKAFLCLFAVLAYSGPSIGIENERAQIRDACKTMSYGLDAGSNPYDHTRVVHPVFKFTDHNNQNTLDQFYPEKTLGILECSNECTAIDSVDRVQELKSSKYSFGFLDEMDLSLSGSLKFAQLSIKKKLKNGFGITHQDMFEMRRISENEDIAFYVS